MKSCIGEHRRANNVLKVVDTQGGGGGERERERERRRPMKGKKELDDDICSVLQVQLNIIIFNFFQM